MEDETESDTKEIKTLAQINVIRCTASSQIEMEI